MVLYGKCKRPQQNSDSDSTISKGRSLFQQLVRWHVDSFRRMFSHLSLTAESRESSSRWTNKNLKSDPAISPSQNSIAAETNSTNPSPRTVLVELETEYQSTEDDTLSYGDSTAADLTPLGPKLGDQTSQRKQALSPCKLIFSFLGSPFRKRNYGKEIKQPLLRCFSYEEIMNATNEFHPGEKSYANNFH